MKHVLAEYSYRERPYQDQGDHFMHRENTQPTRRPERALKRLGQRHAGANAGGR
jgi:hypothetical protein